MKSERVEFGLHPNFANSFPKIIENPSLQLHHVPRRDPSTNFFVKNNYSSVLQLSLLEDLSESHSDAIGLSPSPSREPVWVLVKLLQMWMDGYQNFVRLLRNANPLP